MKQVHPRQARDIGQDTLLRHGKEDEGHIFVYLDTLFERESKTVSDADQDKYTRSLEDQIDFLRRELERKDTIIMSLSQRIPELEGSPEPREGHVTASEEAAEGTYGTPGAGGALTAPLMVARVLLRAMSIGAGMGRGHSLRSRPTTTS